MNWILFAALVFYNWVDYHNTLLLLRLGAVEVNPVLNFLIDLTGTDHAIALAKLAIIIPLGFAVGYRQKRTL